MLSESATDEETDDSDKGTLVLQAIVELFSGSPASSEDLVTLAFNGIPRPPDAILQGRFDNFLVYSTQEDLESLVGRYRRWMEGVGVVVPQNLVGNSIEDDRSPLRLLAVREDPKIGLRTITLTLNLERNQPLPVVTRGLFGEWLPGKCQVNLVGPVSVGYNCQGEAAEIAAAYDKFSNPPLGFRSNRQEVAGRLNYTATGKTPDGTPFSVAVTGLGPAAGVAVVVSLVPMM